MRSALLLVLLLPGCRAPEPEPAPPASAPATAHGECSHERYTLPRRVWILRSERIIQSTFCPRHDAAVVDEFDLNHIYWGSDGNPTKIEDCAECRRLLALPVLEKVDRGSASAFRSRSTICGSAPRRSEGG